MPDNEGVEHFGIAVSAWLFRRDKIPALTILMRGNFGLAFFLKIKL